MKRIKDIINKVKNYTSNTRFSKDIRDELYRLASDTVLPKDIKVVKSSYDNLKLPMSETPITHTPFAAPLIERIIGKHSQTLDVYSIVASDLRSQLEKYRMKKNKTAELIGNYNRGAVDDSQLEVELEKLTKYKPSLKAEEKAQLIISNETYNLHKNDCYKIALYHLQIVGECFLTKDLYFTNETRVCDPNKVIFLPSGKNKEDISKSKAVFESIFIPVEDILTNDNVEYKYKTKLKKYALSEKDYKSGESGEPVREGYTDLTPLARQQRGDWDMVASAVIGINKEHRFSDEVDSKYDADTRNVEVQKLLYTEVTKIQKIYTKEKPLDSDEASYILKHKDYEPSELEESEPTYITNYRVAYYIPLIDEVIIDKPMPITFRNNKLIKNPSIYAGYVKSLSNNKPFSWLNNIKDGIYLRDMVIHNMAKLIRDNLGIVMLNEFKGIPKGISYKDWLMSILEQKMVSVDSAKLVEVPQGEQTMLGNAAKYIFDVKQIDNSANVANLLRILQGIDNLIYTGRGINEQSLGEIGQNARIDNVQQSIQQSTYVDVPTITLYYKTFSDMFNSIIKYVQVITTKENYKLLMNEGDQSVDIDKDTFHDRLMLVQIVSSYKELMLLDTIKRQAAMAVQQKVLPYRDYVKVQKSNSVNEILDILEEAEEELAKRQSKAAQEAQQVELTKFREELKNKLDQVIEREKGRIEAANINANADIKTEEMKLQAANTSKNEA